MRFSEMPGWTRQLMSGREFRKAIIRAAKMECMEIAARWDNRAIKSEIYIDRPRGFGVDCMLITNADTKRPIRYKISGDNIFLEDK